MELRKSGRILDKEEWGNGSVNEIQPRLKRIRARGKEENRFPLLLQMTDGESELGVSMRSDGIIRNE